MARLKARAFALVCVVALLGGCQTRSISDSGYRDDSGWGYGARSSNPYYRGELSEFDILGIGRDQAVSEDIIRAAYTEKKPLAVKKGDAIMLIQSGALLPDEGMVNSFSKYYSVAVFSGIPDQPPVRTAAGVTGPAQSYFQSLRLAAARGGYDKIVAYWGVVESAREGMATKAVSWVPILGAAVPDEHQRMRIRLKVAVIDVRTGQWEMFVPETFDDTATSASANRAMSDQAQVAALKEKVYAGAAESFVARYAR
ncbi:MAG TPA: aminopeptidase [Alphaproteobacteria bacterium]|jgi:hypothetical protein|nr:aminopeptidase [Alphaproteobacteria bacterium]